MFDGAKVQVYFNLHKKCLSVRGLPSRLVVAHTNRIALKDVTFKVSEAGRQRVVREQRKNVHAFAEGTLFARQCLDLSDGGRVTYNPYRFSSFVDPNHGQQHLLWVRRADLLHPQSLSPLPDGFDDARWLREGGGEAATQGDVRFPVALTITSRPTSLPVTHYWEALSCGTCCLSM